MSAGIIAPDHTAALLPILLLAAGIAVFPTALRSLGRRSAAIARFNRRLEILSWPTRVAAVLLLGAALVHLSLLPGHLAMDPGLGRLFAVDTAGFGVAFVLTLATRRWHVPAGLLSLLTVLAYTYYVQGGMESLDLVGILTSVAEIVVIPLALFDWTSRNWRRPNRRAIAMVVSIAVVLASTTLVAQAAGGRSKLTTAMGPVMGSAGGSSAMGDGGAMPPASMAGGGPGAAMAGSGCPGVNAMPMSDGMLMQPVPAAPPTAAEVAATNQLVAATTAGIAQYNDVNAAIAAGYTAVTRTNVPVVHMINHRAFSDNPLADPSLPQTLVYAHRGSKWVLLGAMYMTNATCKQGPDVGGSLTDWHAHINLCFNSSGTVTGDHPDSTGSCPSGEKTHATPFMLHVYTVANNPNGPFELSNSAIAAALRA